MTAARRNALLVLVFALAAGLAGGAWWLVQSTPPEVQAEVVVPVPTTPAPTPREPESNDARSKVPLEGASDEPAAVVATTVAFPLEVELTLVASAVRPSADGVSPLGSDATARLAGSVIGASGEKLRADVEFVAGANEHRLLRSDRDGRFGANDLYPGLSLVRINAPGTPGALRSVLLRKDRDTQLNVSFSRPGSVQGMVRDSTGAALPAATVTLDGQTALTDDQGGFSFPTVAAGETFALVEKTGYAAYLEKTIVAGGQTVEPGKINYVLRRASRLEITIEDRLNVEGQALVYLLPQSLDAAVDFPWYRVNPVAVYPGGTVVVEDLPAKSVTLRLFHAGAVAKPPSRSVTLREGQTEHVSLHLEPAPIVQGVVKMDGEPVAGAEVVLEAPQRSQAMLSVLGESNYLDLERAVLPDFPPAVQRVKTNGAGEFLLSASEGVSKERYLHARSPDGKSTAWKLLRGGETRVDLELEPARGEGEIVIELDGRVQGLNVDVKVDGTPRDRKLLPFGQDLHVTGLAPGTWKLSAHWHGDVVAADLPVDLDKEAKIALTLPEGAIFGQDEDTRKRAGRQ